MHTVPETSEKPGARAPLIVCGMHRSGTSLLDASELRLGEELLEASAGNPRGHFEDVVILEFHRTVLSTGCDTVSARPPFSLDRLSVRRGADGRIARVRYVPP